MEEMERGKVGEGRREKDRAIDQKLDRQGRRQKRDREKGGGEDREIDQKLDR